MLRILWVATCSLTLLACARPGQLRLARPQPTEVAPEIHSLVDLGSLPLPDGRKLSREHSDGVFTPGEWTAVLGRGLAAPDASVSVDGRLLPVRGYLAGGALLVRVPRGLSPRETHTLEVATPRGRAQRTWSIASFVAVSDAADNRLRFLRMSPEADRLFDEDTQHGVELPRVRHHAFSADGGLLYALHAGQERDQYGISVVHMGASERPARVRTVDMELAGKPVALELSREPARLFVLSQREVIAFDLRDSLRPDELGRAPLNERADPVGMALLANGTRCAVLDSRGGALWLLDVERGAPTVLQWLTVRDADGARASIQVLADQADSDGLWVLSGPNLHRLGGRVRGGVDATKRAVQSAAQFVGVGAGPAAEETVEPEGPVPTPLLTRYRLGSGGLEADRELSLPGGFVPLFARSFADGSLFVSGVGSHEQDYGSLPLNLAGARKAFGLAVRNLFFGRILSVSPTGAVQSAIQERRIAEWAATGGE